MSTPTPAISSEGPNDAASQYNAMVYIINSVLAGMQTASLVKVLGCSNDGGVSAVGTVDVQVLTNLQTAGGAAVTHPTIYSLPYFRIQGGANAVILDPQPGDIGAAVFCSRDISSVVAANLGTDDALTANPGSQRRFDFSDGLYFGGMLNGVPTQYVQFTDAGITVVSPAKVTVQAPVVDVEATTSATVNAPVVNIEGGGTIIDGKPFLPHTHISASPGDPTGPVI